jgi:hypothetical protein
MGLGHIIVIILLKDLLLGRGGGDKLSLFWMICGISDNIKAAV